MSLAHLQQSTERPGGCWTCTHWHGETSGDYRALVCRRLPDQPQVPGLPDTRCAYWEREVGADDEVPTPEQRG